MVVSEFSGIALNYKLVGKKHKQTSIVMLHGFGASIAVWREQYSKFSKEFRLLAYDQRGWGSSDKSVLNSYAVEDYVADLTQISSHLGIERFVLVGSSMGGMIAQKYCIENPEKVETLVLVGTRAKANASSVLKQILTIEDEGLEYFLKENLVKSFWNPSYQYSTEFQRVLSHAQGASRDCAIKTLESFSHFDVTGEISRIKIPTLILFGAEDEITPIDEGKYLHSKIPNSTFKIIRGAGHLVMLEKPGEFNSELGNFLAPI
jgi:3-oxoadipate enol-lactonase